LEARAVLQVGPLVIVFGLWSETASVTVARDWHIYVMSVSEERLQEKKRLTFKMRSNNLHQFDLRLLGKGNVKEQGRKGWD
jgi:hypothetical protein